MAEIKLRETMIQQRSMNLVIENLTDKEREMLYELGDWHDQVASIFFKTIGGRKFSFNEKDLSAFLLAFYEALSYGNIIR